MTDSHQILAEGLGITEGPIVLSDGRIFVVSVSRGLIYEIYSSGSEPRVAATPGGGPNGLAVGPDNAIYIAQNGGIGTKADAPRGLPGIQRWELDSSTVEYVLSEGCESPNDLTFGPDGRLWFTDPPGSPWDDQPIPGSVKALHLNSGDVDVIASDLAYPNGLQFSAEGALFVAETRTSNILRFETNARNASDTFATVGVGHPDGLAFDGSNNLYVATSNGDAIVVLDQMGVEVRRISIDGMQFITNVAFTDSTCEYLVVTAAKKGRVFILETSQTP
jgi:gluconolactonase